MYSHVSTVESLLTTAMVNYFNHLFPSIHILQPTPLGNFYQAAKSIWRSLSTIRQRPHSSPIKSNQMVGKMLVHTSSLASQCYTQGQVNLISVRNYTAQNSSLWGSWISQYPRRHCPRTKVYHLLMNSAASSACCCGQVISLNSRKDQKQHFLSCPLVVTPHAEVTHFTGWEKQRNWMKLSQHAVWITTT